MQEPYWGRLQQGTPSKATALLSRPQGPRQSRYTTKYKIVRFGAWLISMVLLSALYYEISSSDPGPSEGPQQELQRWTRQQAAARWKRSPNWRKSGGAGARAAAPHNVIDRRPIHVSNLTAPATLDEN